MTNFPRDLAILIPLLPLMTALIPRNSDRRCRPAKFGLLPMALAWVGSVATLVLVALHGPLILRLYDPSAIAGLGLPLGFMFDRLTAVMMVLVSGVGTLIYRFSLNYMYQDPDYGRFLALIGGTTSVLLCMVASVNLVMLFIFWQLLAYLLYLLAHNLDHEPTHDGAFRMVHIFRLGDAAFLGGIVLAYNLYGTVEFEALFARAAQSQIALHLPLGLQMSGPTAITSLLLIGAMSKSAQFPFHSWLPRALYAPTPVTALLHAGIINAGGFLINRLAPLYALSPTTLHVVFGVGMLTAVLGASMMLTQNDIKKTLGFSTIGQMGYMVVECGLGAFALAVFHLIAHGLFKATVFLNCGNVIHQARQEPKFPADPRMPSTDGPPLPFLTWATGFLSTLLLPLLILLLAHGLLRIPLLQSQASVVFLFLIWITSSQAILTLTRLRAVASWKVSATMLLTLLALVFTYLVAAERFTEFLYPDPKEVAMGFQAAALPGPLFDGLVVSITLVMAIGWFNLLGRVKDDRWPAPPWVNILNARLYVLLVNQLYLDRIYERARSLAMRVAFRLEAASPRRTL